MLGRIQHLPNRSAAEAFLAVIKHGILTGGDAGFGLVHENLETAVLEEFDPTADQLWGVANSKVEPISLGGVCDPVGIADGETISVIGLERAGVRDQEFIGLGVFPDHIPGPTGEPEPVPLTDRVEPETAVAAEFVPRGEVANDSRIFAEVVLDKRIVRDPAEKTDTLGVRSVAVGEVQSVCLGSDLRLGHLTDGEEAPGDLVLVHLAEEVGLVLDRIDPFEKTRLESRMIHPGVVTAGNEIKRGVNAIDKGAELDQPVAEHIRTRGPAGRELCDYGGDD